MKLIKMQNLITKEKIQTNLKLKINEFLTPEYPTG